MKLAVGGRTGECGLNAERIRMNDDEICSSRRKQKPNVCLYMTHTAIRYSVLHKSIVRYFT